MMNSNPLLKRLMNPEKGEVFHSSAFAKVQGSEGIGAASSEGFEARMNREEDRTFVRGYGDSEIANMGRRFAPKAKQYEPSAGDSRYQSRDVRDRQSGELGMRNNTFAAVGRAAMARNTEAGPIPKKPINPPAWKNPGISR